MPLRHAAAALAPVVVRTVAVAVLPAAIVFGAPVSAHAAPQWNAGVVTAGCLLGDGDDWFQTAAFCGAVRGDVLFGRERTRDFGVGPYLALGTAAFDDLRVAGGASLLLPVVDDFPLVASLGGLLRNGSEPGFDARLFWGIRSFNFHGAYNFTTGFVLEAQRGIERGESVLSAGLQIDGFVLALPVLLIAGALK